MTTRSTVAQIKYLLDHIKYLTTMSSVCLTSALHLTESYFQLPIRPKAGSESGSIVSLFSSLRQFKGGNDRVDARAAVFTSEKILKVQLAKKNIYID